MTTLRIGLIGAGRIGQVHAFTLANSTPHAKLVAVSDVLADTAKHCAELYGISKWTTDYTELLSDPTIDAVLICSPTNMHSEMIVAAATSGKHIFCEKPVDLDLAGVNRAIAAVYAAGVVFMVGFNRRFDPNFARVRSAIENGEIGEPHILHIVSRDPAPPSLAYIKVSGGIFLDMAIHDFDMARFLIGSEINEIYAQATVRIDPDIGEAGDVDTAVMMLRFANGVIGTIDNSRKAIYGYDQRVEVFGSGGAIQTANNYAANAVVSDAHYIRRDLPLNFFMQRYKDSYREEIQAFIGSILNNTPPPVSAHDGRMALVIGLAAKISLRENRPVAINEVQ